jgi:hypothetical protein
MTGEEFVTRFNELISRDGGVDLAAASAFRIDVEKDYTDSAASVNLLNTAKERITTLENTNKELHDTNLRLFMMLPNGGGDNSPNSGNDGNEPPTHTGENDPPSPTVNDVVAAMLGKTSK